MKKIKFDQKNIVTILKYICGVIILPSVFLVCLKILETYAPIDSAIFREIRIFLILGLCVLLIFIILIIAGTLFLYGCAHIAQLVYNLQQRFISTYNK